jgi:hypothetical protein
MVSGEQKKISANEAFAKTMGSGDHGPSPALGPTVASEPPKPPAPAPAPAKRSPALLVALVLGGAAIAAGAVFFAMRGNEHHEHRREHPAAIERHVEKPPVVAPPPAIDAAVAVVAVDAVPKAPPPPVKTATPALAGSDTTADPGADADVEAKLVLAQQALRDQRFDKVSSLSNLVITAEHASDRQRARAHMFRGIVQCQREDLEKATSDLRALGGFPGLRRNLLKQCEAGGFALPN